MNRTDLQQLAEARIADAEALMTQGRHACAYYVAGYSVECALKACIAKQIREHDFPDKNIINKSYTHNLETLLGLSGIKNDFDTASAINQDLDINWATVKDWSERSRYDLSKTQLEAESLIDAITSEPNGILTWIKDLW
jgi:hypothetical protein